MYLESKSKNQNHHHNTTKPRHGGARQTWQHHEAEAGGSEVQGHSQLLSRRSAGLHETMSQ